MRRAPGFFNIAVADGLLMGFAASFLTWFGNPVNTGICISCFMENSVGAAGLHPDPRMWYMRPELMGFFLGSFLMAYAGREFRPRSGGTGFIGLGLGAMMMVGSAVFIGCPIKAFLRLAGGDMTAVAGAAGLFAGVFAGLKALEKSDQGLDGGTVEAPKPVAFGLVGAVGLLALLVFVPGAFRESVSGGGSIHAPASLSLGLALAVGALSQRSRFCVTGQVRDLVLTRRAESGLGLYAFALAALAANVLFGLFSFGYETSPGVHTEWWWSFGGMALTGWAAVLAGGCPFRQLVKAGEGDLDAAMIGAGMVMGSILVENWGLGSTAQGTTPQGRMAVLIGFACLMALSMHRREKAA